VGDAEKPVGGRPDSGDVEAGTGDAGVGLGAQEELIDDEDEPPRFDFLAARFSLRFACAFFLSPF
jgi:hypothetical protein